jgi:hypothetical protein
MEINRLTDGLKFGDGITFSEIEPDGFIVSKIAHRDEYPSAPWVSAGAQAAPDLTNHTIGGVARRVYTFDGGNTEERLSSSFEIPHDYMYGQPIEVHVHFRPATTDIGAVKWFFDYEVSPANVSAHPTPLAPVPKVSMSGICEIVTGVQYAHYVLSLGELSDTDYLIGQKIGFNIRRTPNDAQDTYGADAILEQVALHIPVDTAGSRQRYVK